MAPSGTGGGDPPPTGTIQEQDDSNEPRRIAHEILGQAHAVIYLAGTEEVLGIWCPAEVMQDFRHTLPTLYEAVGHAHAEVSSGALDQALRANGIGGAPGRYKRRVLRHALERLSAVRRDALNDPARTRSQRIRAWLRAAVSAAKTPIDSLVQEIPGGHIIKEGLDGILAGLDVVEAGDT
ncbi:hypothetical protein ACIBL3_06990 [Kribbella sp. NPDC050124]|uniref:hypothetical protein n=1 Tax=Kribbella sp. NPDC050124 TaxID=3364114 RepID=UPI003788AA7D